VNWLGFDFSLFAVDVSSTVLDVQKGRDSYMERKREDSGTREAGSTRERMAEEKEEGVRATVCH